MLAARRDDGSGAPTVTPTPSQAPLEPAVPGANPISTVAWLFTPIFQVLFIGLVFFYQLTGQEHRVRHPRC